MFKKFDMSPIKFAVCAHIFVLNMYCVNLKSAVFVYIWNFVLNWILFAFVWLIKAVQWTYFFCRFMQFTNVRMFYQNLMDRKSGVFWMHLKHPNLFVLVFMCSVDRKQPSLSCHWNTRMSGRLSLDLYCLVQRFLHFQAACLRVGGWKRSEQSTRLDSTNMSMHISWLP